jgi:hypothetical protein
VGSSKGPWIVTPSSDDLKEQSNANMELRQQ